MRAERPKQLNPDLLDTKRADESAKRGKAQGRNADLLDRRTKLMPIPDDQNGRDRENYGCKATRNEPPQRLRPGQQ
jgi:hypothetical protein